MIYSHLCLINHFNHIIINIEIMKFQYPDILNDVKKYDISIDRKMLYSAHTH